MEAKLKFRRGVCRGAGVYRVKLYPSYLWVDEPIVLHFEPAHESIWIGKLLFRHSLFALNTLN